MLNFHNVIQTEKYELKSVTFVLKNYISNLITSIQVPVLWKEVIAFASVDFLKTDLKINGNFWLGPLFIIICHLAEEWFLNFV